MSETEHRIGKLVFEISASDRATAARFSETVRARFDAAVVPALQSALDRIDRPVAVIRLDRIDVDLGAVDPAPSADDLGRRIAEALVAVLRAAPPPEAPSVEPGLDDGATFAEFTRFLESGELPWTEPGRALDSLVTALMALDGPAMTRFAERLRPPLIRRRVAERLVRQIPTALVRRLLRHLLPGILTAPAAAMLGPDGATITFSQVRIPEARVAATVDLILDLARNAALPDLGRVLALFTALDPRAPVADFPAAAPKEPERKTEPPVAAKTDEAAAEAPVRPVHAAGAVLLHPFLGAFFQRLDLLAAPDRFRDRDARSRAVLLAHHLATGTDDGPEPETMLFKLLCGMPFHEPLPRRIDRTEDEDDECDALLESVIGHWRRLGRTTPAGLREGFLMRPGRLEHRNGYWSLSIEKRGIDVLLDGLPWALSRVRTPFMKSFLTVDWR